MADLPGFVSIEVLENGISQWTVQMSSGGAEFEVEKPLLAKSKVRNKFFNEILAL